MVRNSMLLSAEYRRGIAPVLAVALAAMAIAPCPANAQSAESETRLPPLEIRDTTFEESYVLPNASVGTKTDTPIMEAPMNVQVVSQPVLLDQNSLTLDDALRNVSGVKSNRTGDLSSESITMRGFTTNTYLNNGMRTENNINFHGVATMTNVESVEVLKGPAAVLYGRGEPGGVVNLVKKQPQVAPYYSVEQQFGSWDHYLTIVDATGPANQDKSLLYRLTASYDDQHSFVDYVHDKTAFIAPVLTWIVSPKTRVTAGLEYTRNSSLSGTSNTSATMPYDASTGQIIWLPRNFNIIHSPYSGPNIFDATTFSFNLVHEFDSGWSLDHKIEYRKRNGQGDDTLVVWGQFERDIVNNTWTVPLVHWKGWGEEDTVATTFDLSRTFEAAGLKHTVLVGADYAKNKNLNGYVFSATNLIRDVLHPDYSAVPPPLDYPNWAGKWYGESTNYGVYIQDQIKLPQNIHVLGGLRYQHASTSGWSVTPIGWGGDGVTRVPDTSWSEHAVTPRFGVVWQARNWLSLYASYTENFGATNQGYDWQHKPLKPEGAKNKEVGVKTEHLDGKLRTGLTYFDLTKTDVTGPDLEHATDPACIPNGCTRNIGEVGSKGVEIDVQGEISPGWNVIATYAYTDARIIKSTNGDEGLRLANVPRNMASLWAVHEFKQESMQGWKMGAGVTTRSSTTDSTNTRNTPGFSLVDVMAAYRFKAGRNKIALQLNIKNLFDKSYYMDASTYADATGGTTNLSYGAPRSATASLKVEF